MYSTLWHSRACVDATGLFPIDGYCNIGNGEADCCCASFIIMPHGDNAKRQMKRPAPILVAETSVAHESSFFPFNPLAARNLHSSLIGWHQRLPKRDIVKPNALENSEKSLDLGRFVRQAKYLRVPASRMRIVST